MSSIGTVLGHNHIHHTFFVVVCADSQTADSQDSSNWQIADRKTVTGGRKVKSTVKHESKSEVTGKSLKNVCKVYHMNRVC